LASLGTRIAKFYGFDATHKGESLSAKDIPSDCQAILTNSRINFRKAGANYSPLQQNHPKPLNQLLFKLRFKSSGENHPIPFESFASKHR